MSAHCSRYPECGCPESVGMLCHVPTDKIAIIGAVKMAIAAELGKAINDTLARTPSTVILTEKNIHEEFARLMDQAKQGKTVMIHKPVQPIEIKAAAYEPSKEELKQNDTRRKLRKLKREKGIGSFANNLFKNPFKGRR